MFGPAFKRGCCAARLRLRATMSDSSHPPIPPSGGTGLNQRLLSSLEALSRASSYLIAVVGLAVLLGWHFDIELLRAGLPGRTPVNPVTALALLLAACALWMYHQARGRPDSAPVRWLAMTAASLVIAGCDHTHWLFRRSQPSR